MRKSLDSPFSVLVLISAFLLPSKLNQARREACYRKAVASFQRDLHIGADRAEVQQYLHSRKLDDHVVRYGGNDADTYEIKIGEEPSNSLVCEDWEGVETSDSAQDPWPDHSE